MALSREPMAACESWRWASRMPHVSCARHRFPLAVIHQTMWLRLRFTLRHRDVEDLLAERGLEVSYGTIRRQVPRFGPVVARRLRRRRRPTQLWYLDEMVVRTAGEQTYLWRAWTTRARSWPSWSSAGGTRLRPAG